MTAGDHLAHGGWGLWIAAGLLAIRAARLVCRAPGRRAGTDAVGDTLAGMVFAWAAWSVWAVIP